MKLPRQPQGSSLRLVAYVLPSMSIAVAALVFLGPGTPKSAMGVRVWGAPVRDSTTLSLRIETLDRLYGVDSSVALDVFAVSATSGGVSLATWTGATKQGDISEVVLHAPDGLNDPVVLTTSYHDHVLVERSLPLAGIEPITFSKAFIHGSTQGDAEFRVEALRGVLAAPFPEVLRFTVSRSGTPVAFAAINVTAVGAELSATPEDLWKGVSSKSAMNVNTDSQGVGLFAIKPLAHHIELMIELKSEQGPSAKWEGYLPILPGAIWLDSKSSLQRLKWISPVPRQQVYVSILGKHGRILGAAIPLQVDDAGFYTGEWTIKDGTATDEEMLYAVVAGDPYEQGAGTASWPLRPKEGQPPPSRIRLLLDGMPEAEAQEQARVAKARRKGLFVLGAAAITEILLLLIHRRLAQRRLEAHLSQAASELDPSSAMSSEASVTGTGHSGGLDRQELLRSVRKEPWLWTLTLVALIGLAFAMIAALGSFR